MANPSAYILSSRHHVYYFRIRVPLHLQTQLNTTPLFNKAFITQIWPKRVFLASLV
jgi:hypothetical protein